MVFEEVCIPAGMDVHEGLPFVDYGFEIAKVPGFGGVFAGEVAVEVDSVVELLLCQGLKKHTLEEGFARKGRERVGQGKKLTARNEISYSAPHD